MMAKYLSVEQIILNNEYPEWVQWVVFYTRESKSWSVSQKQI
jgi:hypothetical protein